MSQPNFEEPFDQELLKDIYSWVDGFELSRQKKNITRDFNDAVLVAEIIHHYHPSVQLHNYPSTLDPKQKRTNWTVLRDKVMKKIGFRLPDSEIDDIINNKPFAVEHLLARLKTKLETPPPALEPASPKNPLAIFTAPMLQQQQRRVGAEAPADPGATVDISFLKQILVGQNLKEVLLKGRKENLLEHDPVEDDPDLKEVFALNARIVALDSRMDELKSIISARDREIDRLEKEFITKSKA